ncbi:MAG: hypothetical protein KKE86_16935, partial [Planctomycetes bacterium]|nr:hypothetical protein [Planctomycetota bacterium]
QVSIYWLHDSCQFEQLANMASVIYQNLGFDRALADKVGRIISECYQVADQAQDLYLKGDCEEEEAAYFLAAEKLKQAERILEYKKSVAVHQVRWWAHFRHRENIRAIYHLFAQNLQEVSIKGLFEAGKLTYNLVRVGFAHNRRDRADAIRYASEYWNILLRSLRKRNDLSYLG